MPQQVRVRRQKVINFQENARASERLSTGMVYREMMLRLQGTIDVGNEGAAFDPSLLGPGDEWAAVKRLELLANGTDVLRNISGEDLRWLNLFQYGVPPRPSTAFYTVVADGTVAFDSTAILPLWTPRSVRPIDTALDARLLSSLEMTVTWGAAADISRATTGAPSFTVDPTLTVHSLESFGIQGPFAQSRIPKIAKSSVGVQNEFQIELPVSVMYRGFLLHAKDASGDDQADAINNIKLRSGSTVFFDSPGAVVQDWNSLRMGIQKQSYDRTDDAVNSYFVSENSDFDSVYFIDLVTDGRMTEAIDTLGFSEMILELDVGSAIETLDVYPLQIIPIRGAGNGNGNGSG